jgi:cytochrome c oxidase subunit 4
MSEHVVPVRVYLLVFAALMIGTITTYYAAMIDMEKAFHTNFPLNSLVALAIAVTKAVLVILFFMHVKYSTRLTKVVVVAGFFWLGIMLTITMSDYLFRALGSPVGVGGPK